MRWVRQDAGLRGVVGLVNLRGRTARLPDQVSGSGHRLDTQQPEGAQVVHQLLLGQGPMHTPGQGGQK